MTIPRGERYPFEPMHASRPPNDDYSVSGQSLTTEERNNKDTSVFRKFNQEFQQVIKSSSMDD